MSHLTTLSLVDSVVTVETICSLKQVSLKLQQLLVALGLWPAGGRSGNRAPKVSKDPSTASCCGARLYLESNAVGGNQIWDSEGLHPACWHHSVMASGGGSLHHLPRKVSLSSAQMQLDAGVPDGGWAHVLQLPLTAGSAVTCCHLLLAGGCSTDLSTPQHGGCPAGPRGAGATSPSPGLVTSE